MITFLGFFFGTIMMVIGFLMVWKTKWFLQNMGDLGQVFGAVGMQWMSWKLSGVVLLALGFFVAFGILNTILGLTVGRLFTIGGF